MTRAGWTVMMMHIRHTVFLAGLAMLLVPGNTMAQPTMGGVPSMGPGGPTEVGVITIARQDVPYTATLPGRVAASKVAEIRPQVGGIIESVDFREGREVRAGDLLYEIQSDSFEASLAAAKASLERAKVTASGAKATVERYEKLVGSVSQTTLDDARLSLLQAEADVAAAEASMTVAQINLDRTHITAPISGAIGLSSVNQGTLVIASQTSALATIRQLDPVYVDLVDSSANLLKLRKALQTGTVSGNGGRITKVTLVLEDGTQYNQTGVISQAEAVVSQTTGTFGVRAAIDNPDRLLMPGMFVRATVELGTENAFLVPQRAVTFNSAGKATVLIVSKDKKAEARVLETSRSYDNAWVVTAGLEDGDEIIVDGLQKISNGSKVSPLPVTISDNGVIVQTITDTAAPSGAPTGQTPPAGASSGGSPPSGTPPDGAPASGEGAAQ